jgi:hypothetical protein
LYSLQWMRVLRPMAYFRGVVALHPKTNGPLRTLTRLSSPGCSLIDSALSKLPLRAFSIPATDLRSHPADAGELLECIQEVGWRDALKPSYDPESFRWLLAQAAAATRHGALRMAVVREPGGARAGWYAYYAKRGGIATAMQIGASGRHFENVFLALLRDAWMEGAAALTGQAVPRALRGLSNQHCSFNYPGNCVLVQSRDPELLGCILQGEAALTRLDGEWWTRFAVEDWES